MSYPLRKKRSPPPRIDVQERRVTFLAQSGSRPQQLRVEKSAVVSRSPHRRWFSSRSNSGSRSSSTRCKSPKEKDLPRDFQVSVEGTGLYHGTGNTFVAVGLYIAPGHMYNGGTVIPLKQSALDSCSSILAALHGIVIAKKLNLDRVCINSRSRNMGRDWKRMVEDNSHLFRTIVSKGIMKMLESVEGMEVTFHYQHKPHGWIHAWTYARRAYNMRLAELKLIREEIKNLNRPKGRTLRWK